MVATKVSSYQDITFDVLADAVDEVLNYDYTSFAPLGKSSRNLVVCGIDGDERKEGVSLRLHSGSIEMLVCDTNGYFMFYGKLHPTLGKTLIKSEFYRIFEAVKPSIKKR
jgi:hypothetical protein